MPASDTSATFDIAPGAPDRLRFDFRHDQPLTRAEIAAVEDLVGRAVLDNQPVLRRDDVPLAEAKAAGAMALFGEKYGDRVRMIEIPGGPVVATALGQEDGDTYSLELCGGTASQGHLHDLELGSTFAQPAPQPIALFHRQSAVHVVVRIRRVVHLGYLSTGRAAGR